MDTEFLAMLDDDVIPRRDFLRFSVESLVAEAGPDGKFPGNAVLGTRGWIIPKKGSGRPMFSGIDWKQGDRVELATEVDMLCSHWFTRTKSVAAMFIEEVLNYAKACVFFTISNTTLGVNSRNCRGHAVCLRVTSVFKRVILRTPKQVVLAGLSHPYTD